MSSRGSISQHQGRASLTRTTIGSSKSVQALMVRIDWTDAKVVHIQARKSFAMQASTVQVKVGDYKVLAHVSVNIHAGQGLYFVASDEFAGYYYLLMYSESYSAFSCTCPKSAQFHKACDHQQYAMAFVGHRHAEQVARQAEVTMPNGTRRMASQVNDACLNSLDAINAAYAEADAKWQAKQEQMIANLASVA